MPIQKHNAHNAIYSIDSIAKEILDELAKQFPICMSSDEFHFFPQTTINNHGWSGWDDFSIDAIKEMTRRISEWEHLLLNCETEDLSLDDLIDVKILRHIIRTVSEQLNDIAVHRCQPSFYLTILSIGLAGAVDIGPHALDNRIQTVPEFMDQARENLKRIPRIFRDLACEMILKFKPWLFSLDLSASSLSSVEGSLDRFNDHLHKIPTTEEFLLPLELYERIAFHHMNCCLDVEEISWQLEQEISETGKMLAKYAEAQGTGSTWQEIIENLPQTGLPQNDSKKIYEATISDLASHCMTKGLVSPELVEHCPVSVEEIPDHLLPVRSSAAFSMPPGHPPKGGTFFIMKDDHARTVPSDWRLLTAHETFPGHHLLDSCRWNLERPIRRHVEFPIYYEGWASFSEELLFDTGFFKDKTDTMLLAKRRFWRAIRGLVDLDINTRRRSLEDVCNSLIEYGMVREKAQTMVQRYILKPGYQLAYTIGRRRFKKIYDKNPDPTSFACEVLSLGEIGFENLEKILESGG